MTIKANSYPYIGGRDWDNQTKTFEAWIVETDTPIAEIRGYGIYAIEYSGETGIRYSIINIKRAIAQEAGAWIGSGWEGMGQSTLNEALEHIVDFFSAVAVLKAEEASKGA
jgi:hypothetical protein